MDTQSPGFGLDIGTEKPDRCTPIWNHRALLSSLNDNIPSLTKVSIKVHDTSAEGEAGIERTTFPNVRLLFPLR